MQFGEKYRLLPRKENSQLITIQLASASDLVSLANLFEELVGEKTDITKMRDQFYRIQSNPDYVVLVAKERDSVVGSVMGLFVMTWSVIVTRLWYSKML